MATPRRTRAIPAPRRPLDDPPGPAACRRGGRRRPGRASFLCRASFLWRASFLCRASFLSDPLVVRVLAAAPACGKLGDIEQVVILIQENRSFDHCFGTHRGFGGFCNLTAPSRHDSSGLDVFAPPGFTAPGYGGHLRPLHIDSSDDGECTSDIDHAWAPQHAYRHNGAMDAFLLVAPDPVPSPPRAQPAQEPGRSPRPSGTITCPR